MPSAMVVAPAAVAVPRAVTGVPPATPGQVIPAVRCPLAPALHVAVAPPAGGERVGGVSGLLGGPAGRAGAACRRHGAARLEWPSSKPRRAHRQGRGPSGPCLAS